MSVQTVFRLVTPVAVVPIDTPSFLTSSIQEPVKWADVLLTLDRDEVYHGTNANYSDGKLKLEFTCDSGRTLINEQIRLHGTDAVIRLQVVEIDPVGAERIEYDGKLDRVGQKQPLWLVLILLLPGLLLVRTLQLSGGAGTGANYLPQPVRNDGTARVPIELSNSS